MAHLAAHPAPRQEEHPPTPIHKPHVHTSPLLPSRTAKEVASSHQAAKH